MNISGKSSRRAFLHLGAGAAAAGISDMLAPRARAAVAGRAVVCIYLLGGNDSNNMVVPLDSPAYDRYAATRGVLALSRDSLLPVDSGGAGKFGFHPSLPGLRDLYNQNALAVAAGVGPAIMNSALTPAPHVRYLPNGYLGLDWSDTEFVTLPHGVSLAGPGAKARRGPVAAIRQSASTGGFPNTVFGRSLEQIAIALRSGGPNRSVFVVGLDGFATRSSQLTRQANAFAVLDNGLTAFYRSLKSMGLAEQVTVYTTTEFNRTLAPTANGGSAPAWAGHELVLGGSVLGGRIYGRFPSLELGGPDDATGNGAWRPSTLDVQYISTVAAWSGRSVEGIAGYEPLSRLTQPRLDFLTA